MEALTDGSRELASLLRGVEVAREAYGSELGGLEAAARDKSVAVKDLERMTRKMMSAASYFVALAAVLP